MDLTALKTELDAGHPETGAYSATDSIAADEINAINRDAPAPLESIRNYFLLERKGDMTLMGRLSIVAQTTRGDVDPLDDVVTMTNAHITAAKTMLFILDPPGGFSLDLNDSRFQDILDDLAAGSGAKVIAPADKTALLAFSTNIQSRATELGLGNVGTHHVTSARAL